MGIEGDCEDNRDNANRGITEAKGRKDSLHHLDDQPRRDPVGGTYAKDITTLELIE